MRTYTRLPRNTSRDNDDLGPLKSLGEAIVRREEALNLRGGGDVGKICSNSGCVDDIVQAQLPNEVQ